MEKILHQAAIILAEYHHALNIYNIHRKTGMHPGIALAASGIILPEPGKCYLVGKNLNKTIIIKVKNLKVHDSICMINYEYINLIHLYKGEVTIPITDINILKHIHNHVFTNLQESLNKIQNDINNIMMIAFKNRIIESDRGCISGFYKIDNYGKTIL